MKKLKTIHYYRIALFIVSLTAVCLMWQRPNVVLIILTLVFLELNRSFSWQLVKSSTLVALLGSIAEIIAIYFGSWKYSSPQIAGLPIWLIPLWGVAGLFFVGLADILNESVGKE